MTLTTFDTKNPIDTENTKRIATFLHTHLEQYGDDINAITKAINYAAEKHNGRGGYVFTLHDENTLIGAVVINKTGMGDYIPENILVYIATHNAYRGQGLGRKIMTYAIDNCEGDIALHVEKDNPAKFLYEKLGFTNPYLEMRLKR